MNPPPWLPDVDSRVIEFGPVDNTIAEYLRGHGRTKYLGLTLPGADVEPGALAGRMHPLSSPSELRANNADVVILNGEFSRCLWYRHIGRAKFALVSPDGAREARLAGRMHRRPTPTTVDLGGRQYLLVELHDMPWLGARRYCSQIVGVADLPGLLDARDVRYVVLRWFERLPHMDPGEDLDVLVADDDVESFVSTIEAEPGSIPADIYTESGLPGFDFATIAYYPPAIAKRILERSVVTPAGFRVPCPEDHFLSLGYHAAYHKGYSSGLLSRHEGAPDASVDHAYERILTELGAEHGFEGSMTLEHLDEHLAAQGWQPPRDALSKLSHRNAWVRDHFFADSVGVEPPELVVFLLRERALADEGLVSAAQEILRANGFEVLHTRLIDAEDRERCASAVRGGNWGPGPFAFSGGTPALAIVALHDRPESPSAAEARQHPALSNALVYRSKLQIRDAILEGIDSDQHFNPLHSSDNDAEAWHYLELAAPDLVHEVRHAVDQRRAELRSCPVEPDDADRRITIPAPRDMFDLVRPQLGRAKRAAVGHVADLVRRVIDRRSTPPELRS